jgi:hypothetical protein
MASAGVKAQDRPFWSMLAAKLDPVSVFPDPISWKLFKLNRRLNSDPA